MIKKYAILLLLTMELAAGKKKLAKISCLRAGCGFVVKVPVKRKDTMCEAHSAQSHSPMRKRYDKWSKFDEWQTLFFAVHNIQNEGQLDTKFRELRDSPGYMDSKEI